MNCPKCNREMHLVEYIDVNGRRKDPYWDCDCGYEHVVNWDEEWIEIAMERTKAFEGYRDHVYLDQEGIETILYGLNVSEGNLMSMSKKSVVELLRRFIHNLHDLETLGKTLLKEKILDASVWAMKYGNGEPKLMVALIDMYYNMGYLRVMGFKKMLNAIKKFNYIEASEECLDSRYARNSATRKRAKDNARLIIGN